MVLRAGFHGTVGQPSAQVIDGSLKFDSSATNYLKKTPSISGNRRSFTISFWVKRSQDSANEPGILSTYDGVGGNPAFTCYFTGADKLRVYDENSGYRLNLTTTQLFRDYNGWYHIVISIDTTQTTTSDKAKLYVNGVRVTEFGTEVYPTDNVTNFQWNTATAHNIGRHVNAYDGNISNFYNIDGQVLGPEYFAFTDPLTNTWRPKKFEGPTSPNDGTTWSSNLTVSNNYTIQTPEYAFDNDNFGTYAETSSGTGDAVYTFSPTSTIRANSSVRVSAFAANGQSGNHVKITYNNGVEVTKTAADLGLGTPGTQVWFDLSSYINFPADISSIEYSSIGGGGRLAAIEIDGILLIDGLNDPKGFGTNGFYLPFDGNSPIGQDKSSRGNDWTPQYNFGGSNTIEKATGALPILNTTNGGNTAAVGVRTDATVAAGVGTCALALPLFNSKEDVSKEIDSKSSQTKSISINGDPTGITTVSNFYGGSYYFDTTNATDDYLYTSSVYSDLNFKTGDFTIEAWCYASSSARAGLWQLSYIPGGLRPDDLQLSCHYQNTKFNFGSAGGSRINGKEYSTNRWHHVAEVRKDGVISTYINGVLDQSWTDTSTYWEGDTYVCVGGYWNTSYLWNGYIQDFRVYNGVAKYTEDFIPASTNPDILPDTPSGVSGSSKLDKIIDGAVYFDGIDDYLTIPWSSDFDLGQDSDFTIEFFVNFQDDATQSTLLSWGADEGNRFDIGCQSANQLRVFAKQGGSGQFSHNATIIPGKWHHVALVRHVDFSGSTDFIGFYIDGIARYTANGNPTMPTDTSNGIDIGRRRYGASVTDYFRGYISNLRIIKGSAAYPYDPDNITVPTEPLTNVTNTTLLCCQSTTKSTESAVAPSTSWIPTGYTYWNGMDDNWNNTGTTTSDLSASSSGDWIDTALPSSGKYYFETIVNDPSQYRVLGISIGQSGAGAGYTDNLFGWYWNGTGTPPLFLTRTSAGNNRSGNSPNPQHGDTSELTFYDGDILMWAWDADNDKIYFGRNGTWYNNGDPAAGTGHIIEGEDLSANSHYLKVGYMNAGSGALNALTLTNVPSSDSGSSTLIEPNRTIVNFNLVDKASNFNQFNTDINTVRGQETSYATLNPLATQRSGALTLSDGNLRATVGVTRTSAYASLPFVGKMYYEVTYVVDRAYVFGMAPSIDFNTTADTVGQRFIGESSGSYGVADDGTVYHGNASQLPGGATIETFGLNDCMGWAYDTDSGKYSIFKNGRHLGTFTASTSRTYYPAITLISNSAAAEVNFGQKPFKFPPPDGYGPVNAANVRPETVITRPDQYVGVTTYSGNNLFRDISVGFKPDLVWVKEKTQSGAGALNHVLCDSVRGAANILSSNNTLKQFNNTSYVSGFVEDGFSIRTEVHVNGDPGTPYEYIAWSWKAGGGPGITSTSFWKDDKEYASSSAMGLTNGSATIRSASVGTKQGFSIVAYNSTGSSLTLDHGLSQKPDFFIFKCTSHDQHWGIGHSYDYNGELYFDTNEAGSSTTSWGSGPDNNVFTLGTSDYVNTANREYVCYSWHDVPGLQKFGSFTGNGDADGPFIELGFRPAIVWVKRTTTNGYSWVVQDSERQKYNPVDEYLLLNSNNAFGSGFNVDLLSNGFKLRHSNGNMNSSVNYIYCAWAESPSVNLYGATSNAR